jgi:hypothetical protein
VLAHSKDLDTGGLGIVPEARGTGARRLTALAACLRIERSGPVAQLGARFHGMEEVIGSIPIRSTNYFKHLAPPPFRDFVATLSQIPKPHHEPASQALSQPYLEY